MNDRFKFRAWDKSFCRMIYNIFFFWKENTITMYELHKDASKSYLPNSHIVLEQCTGLKDKNGKLIYENDILQLERKDICGYNVHHYVVNTKIERQKNGQYVAISNDYRYYCWETNLELVTVIGNIHENPELLEVKNGK